MKLSPCCSARIIRNDICSICHEHCEPEFSVLNHYTCVSCEHAWSDESNWRHTESYCPKCEVLNKPVDSEAL